jgi:hypothetical protein
MGKQPGWGNSWDGETAGMGKQLGWGNNLGGERTGVNKRGMRAKITALKNIIKINL